MTLAGNGTGPSVVVLDRALCRGEPSSHGAREASALLERLLCRGGFLRPIEAATGVSHEATGGHLESAGTTLRTPGSWGARPQQERPRR